MLSKWGESLHPHCLFLPLLYCIHSHRIAIPKWINFAPCHSNFLCRKLIFEEEYNVRNQRSSDILLFASDGKIYFQPAAEIHGEEMALTATPQRSFESYGTGSSHASPSIVLLWHDQLLISFTSLSLRLPRLYFLTFTPFGSNHFSCWTRDDRNSFGCVTLAIDHHSFGSTVVKTIFVGSY